MHARRVDHEGRGLHLGRGAAYEGERRLEGENGLSRVGEGVIDSTTAPPSYTGSGTAAPEKSSSHIGAEAVVAGAGLGAAAYEIQLHHEARTQPVTTRRRRRVRPWTRA
jgi:hypothetical protein